MRIWEKLFGSSERTGLASAAVPPSTQQPIPTQEQLVFCDCCNEAASFTTGTYFTEGEFLMLLQKGLKPHHSVFMVTEVCGIPRETLIAALPGQITLTFSTGWLLCPSCAPEANSILAKPAGNLPGGEPGGKTRERTVRDAGTGKMLSLARVVATKAMTGGSISTVQADYYIISIVPPVPDPASRDVLILRLLASAGYTKGTADVNFAVSTSGAAALEAFTDALLMKYEQTVGKEVDLNRSKLHDFGGSGFPQGKLAAVYHTGKPYLRK